MSAMTAPLPYNLPQGILIDGRVDQAVPRKVGAYDTEGIDEGAAVPAELQFFVSPRSFQEPVALTKQYGRDTNITSKDGGMAKGEKLYAYGITAKIDAYDANLNTAANSVWFDQIRRLWGIASLEWKLGGDEFMTAQGRDVPVWAPKPTHAERTLAIAADSFLLLDDICRDGMYDVTIEGEPYLLDSQEDFRVIARFNPQTLQMVAETYITVRIEGLRLKAVRA